MGYDGWVSAKSPVGQSLDLCWERVEVSSSIWAVDLKVGLPGLFSFCLPPSKGRDVSGLVEFIAHWAPVSPLHLGLFQSI